MSEGADHRLALGDALEAGPGQILGSEAAGRELGERRAGRELVRSRGHRALLGQSWLTRSAR